MATEIATDPVAKAPSSESKVRASLSDKSQSNHISTTVTNQEKVKSRPAELYKPSGIAVSNKSDATPEQVDAPKLYKAEDTAQQESKVVAIEPPNFSRPAQLFEPAPLVPKLVPSEPRKPTPTVETSESVTVDRMPSAGIPAMPVSMPRNIIPPSNRISELPASSVVQTEAPETRPAEQQLIPMQEAVIHNQYVEDEVDLQADQATETDIDREQEAKFTLTPPKMLSPAESESDNLSESDAMMLESSEDDSQVKVSPVPANS